MLHVSALLASLAQSGQTRLSRSQMVIQTRPRGNSLVYPGSNHRKHKKVPEGDGGPVPEMGQGRNCCRDIFATKDVIKLGT